MRYSIVFPVIAFAASASAATIQVAVGKDGNTFTPSNFAAQVGDTVEFSFFAKVTLSFLHPSFEF